MYDRIEWTLLVVQARKMALELARKILDSEGEDHKQNRQLALGWEQA